MKCVCISCFDQYSTRMKFINDFFRKRGDDVTYLYADFDHFTKALSVKNYVGGQVIPVPPYARNLSIARLKSHHQFSKSTVEVIEYIKPDLIYCMIPPNSLVRDIAKYKKKTNVKVIFDCYDMWPESFPYGKLNYVLALPFWFWGNLRKKYIGVADVVLAVSEHQKELLQIEVNATKIQVLKPAIEEGDIPKYNCDISDGLSFCYLGMINHITDMELGVSLLSELRKHCKVTLHIIGEGQNLQEFVSRLEAANVCVICHGVVYDMDEKNEIFSQCNIGLNIPRKEIKSSMSLKSIEYMRAGLPFVNSGIGDTKSIVEKEHIGINIYPDNIPKTVEEILNTSEEELLAMHISSIEFYQKEFKNQRLERVFDGVL